jgi:hypothetical protein
VPDTKNSLKVLSQEGDWNLFDPDTDELLLQDIDLPDLLKTGGILNSFREINKEEIPTRFES